MADDTERDVAVTMSEDELLENAQKYLDPEHHAIKRYVVKEPLGFALLIGSDRCENQDVLRCVRADLMMMERALTDSMWTVENPCVKRGCSKVSLSGDAYVDIMKDISEKELDKYSCFLYYYSGHGTPNGIVFSGGDYLAFSDVVETVCSQPSLKGKPKVIIFDTCRNLPPAPNLDPDFEVKGPVDKEAGGEAERKTPPDTIVCFSTDKGEASYGTGRGGSIYTIQLAQAMRNFSNVLSFGEIMTQVTASTNCMSSARLGVKQHPVYTNGLNYQLLLNTESVSPDSLVVKLVDSSYLRVPLSPRDPNLERKGPLMVVDRRAHTRRPSSPVMVDSRKTRQPRRTFSSQQEVEKRLDELGEGVSVFICYAPDSESPYNDPRERQSHIRENERLVSLLAHDLTCHGFQVMIDLHMQDNEPRSWVRWYINRIRLCSHVILVCSPAFNELFTRERLQSVPKDLRAQHIRMYSDVIYDEYTKDVIRGSNRRKFIPVMLDRAYTYRRDECVPSLLRGGSVYDLFETTPRQFVYSERDRDFEKLVCRMAGINRAEISGQDIKIHDVQGIPLPSSRDQERRHLQAMSQSRPGYKTIDSSVGRTPSSSVPQWPDPVVPTSLASGGYQWPGQPQPHGFPGIPQRVAPNPQIFPPPAVHQPLPTAPLLDPSTLPNKPPNRRITLWLSQRIVKWKFFARHLELPEYEIQRITEENPHDVGEQCYQMFHMWHRQCAPEDYTYKTIGKILLDDEKNKALYHEFVKEVLAVET